MNSDHIKKVKAFYRKSHRFPSYTEIMEMLGFKSRNAAYKLINNLEELGYAKRIGTRRIAPGRMLMALPMVGTVQAGFPSPAEEELNDTMTLDEYLVPNKDAVYLFKVSGDSMHDAGIMDGDMAIVERGRTPKDGDIVLAEIDRQWTLKYFRKESGKVWLEPANKRYKPIYPTEELKIPAVLVSVVRRYKL